jgi:phage tail protein X
MFSEHLYRSVQGDTIDLICYKYYGSVPGVIEKVMEANPVLAESGPLIAENTLVLLPEVSAASNTISSVQLWS